MARVLFDVHDRGRGIEAETLWTRSLGEDRYVIENSPFCAYNISLHDVIHAPYCEKRDVPVFGSVLSKSGNRTLRIIFGSALISRWSSKRLLGLLASSGCTYERANKNYVSLVVPSAVDIGAIRKVLRNAGARWEQADPAYDGLYPDEI
jgi:hypothetical protein